MVGGCKHLSIARPSGSLRPRTMLSVGHAARPLIALAAALLASPASADTLDRPMRTASRSIADGQLQHFTGLLIGDDGKVVRVLHAGEAAAEGSAAAIDAQRPDAAARLHRRARPRDGPRLRTRCSSTSSGTRFARRSAAAAARLCGSAPRREVDHRRSAGTRNCGRTRRFPTAADLDAVVSDRPVVLERVDGHALVANSAAMKAAGVTAATPAPSGGRDRERPLRRRGART